MILKLNELLVITNAAKSNNNSIVFTNGCFDILHSGHCKYLNEAKKLGDILIVGINSDLSINRIKGTKRPIITENERAFIISTLKSVNYVVIFDEDTPHNIIKTIIPDVLVKGNDYSIDDIVGADTVIKNGGKVITIPIVEGLSTTKIISKIISNNHFK